MVRPSLVAALALSLLAVLPAPLLARQDATPIAPAAATESLNLGSLTLRPADLAEVGLTNFGMANESSLRDAEADAILSSAGDPQGAADRLNLYRLAEFRQRYVGSMLRPRVPLERLPSGLVAAEERVTTAIAEYATAGGAELAFSVLEGSLDDQGIDIPSTRQIGDESDLTRSSLIDEASGNTALRLELSFRVGNLFGDVAIVNYAGQEPELAVVEELGELLLARINEEAGHPGPGLSKRVLRIDPVVTWIERGRVRDFYVRLDGVRIPTFAQIAAAIREETSFTEMPAPQAPGGTVLPQSTYMFWTPLGDGDPLQLPLYVSWLDDYESAGQAGAALHAVTTDLGPGYTHVREFLLSSEVGSESRAFAYTYEGDPSGPVQGHVVMSRVGDFLVRVQVDAPDGVRRAGVIALAQLQVECIRSSAVCLPVPVAEVLADLLPGGAT
jgi:hypothetical protein